MYRVGDTVALLGLSTPGMNHRQGKVTCRRGERYGVLLVGAGAPIAVRPVNLRPISRMPVYLARPQEHAPATGPVRWRFGEPPRGTANVVLRSETRGGQPPPAPDGGESSSNGHRRARKGRKRTTPDAAHAEGEVDDSDEGNSSCAGWRPLPFADDQWRDDPGAVREWWAAPRSGALCSLVRNFQEALRSAACYQGQPVAIAAPPSPKQCAQCMLTLSMTQYAGRCDLCGLICLQCLFEVGSSSVPGS